MTNLLLRVFIRNYDRENPSASHSAIGTLSGIVGVVCNILLFAAKLAAGLLSGSVSIVADAVNNLSDTASSGITFWGFRMAQRPADKNHPYGHARYEYLAGFVVSTMILFIGFELSKSSIGRIINPNPIVFSSFTILVMVFSILVKLWMSLFFRSLGKRIASPTLQATSLDSRNDVIATSAVLLGCLIHHFTGINLDGWIGLLVALFIILMGVKLLKSSFGKILSPAPVSFSLLTAFILVVSVLVKLYMSIYNRNLGKKINSPAMEATAADCRSDALATTVVLLTMLISHFTEVNIDGWAGVLVSFSIFWAGFGAARETINPLLGQSPDPELVEEIRREVLAAPDVLGIHDLIVHDYGPGRRMVSLHAEVAANGDILALHDSIDRLEHHLRDQLGCETVIHMDPIVTDDESLAPLRRRITELIQTNIDPNIQLHDFRIVTGPTHTNIIFDAVAPFGFRMTDEDLKKEISRLVRTLGENYFTVVDIDHTYIQ